MIIEIIYFLIYCLILILLEKVLNPDKGFELNLSNMFFVALMVYTVLPLFDCVINVKHVEYILPFELKCIVLSIAIIIGFKVGQKSKFKYSVTVPQYRYMQLSAQGQIFWTLFWTAVMLCFITINIVIIRGGFNNILNASYRESYAKTNNNIAALMFIAIPYAMIFNDSSIISKRRVRAFATVITLFVVMIFIIMGNRNFAIMALIALFWTKFKNRNFNKIFVYTALLGGIVLLGIIAVMREYNIFLVLKGDVDINWKLAREYAFAFANGELGTTFAFERYADKIAPGFSFPHRYGYSYLILPLLNLMPRALWPNKPMVYSDYFSHYGFGVFDGMGYGFSPIYEAEINFGILWWVTFLVVGFFLARCSKKMKEEQAFLNIGLVACLILNVFRIDMSTCFKFFAMMWVFKWAILMSFKFFIFRLDYYIKAKV